MDPVQSVKITIKLFQHVTSSKTTNNHFNISVCIPFKQSQILIEAVVALRLYEWLNLGVF